MSHGRRTNDRRRRVLYSAYHADEVPSTAASRREALRLREARRPPAAYGSRVHRRLRARWFSLVPVRRRSTIIVAGLLAGLAILLCFAHYASVAWPWIANRPEIRRPLRLDRPDSFGRYVVTGLLAAAAGASLLIYQMRRYRNDDYKGRYRLWRLVLIVMALGSVNSLVSLIDWGGALLDAGFGKRVALTGSDWIRLVVSFGGAILALQLIAEVRRSKFALGMMLLACAFLATHEAANWNVLEINSMARWVTVTSMPMFAVTSLFIAFGAYLRMLYREVRQIEDSDSLLERMQQMRNRLFQRSPRDESEQGSEQERSQQPERNGGRNAGQTFASVRKTEQDEEELEDEEFEPEESESRKSNKERVKSRPRRRWFGLRRAKTTGESSDNTSGRNEPSDPRTSAEPSSTPAKKRGRFAMRLKPQPNDAAVDEAASSRDDASDSEETASEQAKPRRGLGGWLKRKPGARDGHGGTGRVDSGTSSGDSDDPNEEIDPDEIDWNSLSKAERRRLRKQLKRQKRVA